MVLSDAETLQIINTYSCVDTVNQVSAIQVTLLAFIPWWTLGGVGSRLSACFVCNAPARDCSGTFVQPCNVNLQREATPCCEQVWSLQNSEWRCRIDEVIHMSILSKTGSYIRFEHRVLLGSPMHGTNSFECSYLIAVHVQMVCRFAACSQRRRLPGRSTVVCAMVPSTAYDALMI